MPKQVNHEERKLIIAEATWKVIIDKGIEGATVRSIADEANLSIGALRHYFTSQEELLIFAWELVKEKVTNRILAMYETDMSLDELLVRFCLELIPLHTQSQAEMTVWFNFISNAQYRHHFQQDDGILLGLTNVMKMLESNGRLKPTIEREDETETLYALVDGLAIHCMFTPDRLTKERIIQIIVKHVNRILLFPLKPETFIT